MPHEWGDPTTVTYHGCPAYAARTRDGLAIIEVPEPGKPHLTTWAVTIPAANLCLGHALARNAAEAFADHLLRTCGAEALAAIETDAPLIAWMLRTRKEMGILSTPETVLYVARNGQWAEENEGVAAA